MAKGPVITEDGSCYLDPLDFQRLLNVQTRAELVRTKNQNKKMELELLGVQFQQRVRALNEEVSALQREENESLETMKAFIAELSSAYELENFSFDDVSGRLYQQGRPLMRTPKSAPVAESVVTGSEESAVN